MVPYKTHERESLIHLENLSRLMRFSWLPKISQGFFMRSETFFNFLEYLKDPQLGMGEKEFKYYGGDLLTKSHGEGFLSLFKNRFSNGGIYLLDEPEAALSPQWQIEFLKVLKSFENKKDTQVIMITHSPLLMSYPGAEVYHLGTKGLVHVHAEETEHFKLMQRFYENPKLFIEDALLKE